MYIIIDRAAMGYTVALFDKYHNWVDQNDFQHLEQIAKWVKDQVDAGKDITHIFTRDMGLARRFLFRGDLNKLGITIPVSEYPTV